MTDAQGSSSLTIPADTQAKFAELLELIKQSESMNDEERQYWVNLLPAMTPEQIQNLQGILENEREQLKAIDAKYAAHTDATKPVDVAQIGKDRKQRQSAIKHAEQSTKSDEDKHTEDILKQIEG